MLSKFKRNLGEFVNIALDGEDPSRYCERYCQELESQFDNLDDLDQQLRKWLDLIEPITNLSLMELNPDTVYTTFQLTMDKTRFNERLVTAIQKAIPIFLKHSCEVFLAVAEKQEQLDSPNVDAFREFLKGIRDKERTIHETAFLYDDDLGGLIGRLPTLSISLLRSITKPY